MEKKAYPNIRELLQKEDNLRLKPKTAKLPSRLFAILKFLFGILLLPFVYAVSISFVNELNAVESVIRQHLWAGVATFLMVYLFIWEPARIYGQGQQLLELVFQFFRPLVKVAPYLLPTYTIILLIIYGILSFILKSAKLVNFFVFACGFTAALHLVFSAKTLRSKQEDFLKGNYIFGFSFIYIVNLSLFAFCLNLILKTFSFVNFANNFFKISSDMIYAVFKQLFMTGAA